MKTRVFYNLEKLAFHSRVFKSAFRSLPIIIRKRDCTYEYVHDLFTLSESASVRFTKCYYYYYYLFRLTFLPSRNLTVPSITVFKSVMIPNIHANGSGKIHSTHIRVNNNNNNNDDNDDDNRKQHGLK